MKETQKSKPVSVTTAGFKWASFKASSVWPWVIRCFLTSVYVNLSTGEIFFWDPNTLHQPWTYTWTDLFIFWPAVVKTRTGFLYTKSHTNKITIFLVFLIRVDRLSPPPLLYWFSLQWVSWISPHLIVIMLQLKWMWGTVKTYDKWNIDNAIYVSIIVNH